MSLNIAAIGECMVEFSPLETDRYQLGFAGDTFNTAVYLSRLLPQPRTVSYITCLGDDDLSAKLLKNLQTENLDTSLVFSEKNATVGAYLISNDRSGERQFTYWRNESAAKQLLAQDRDEILLAQLAEYDLIYLSGISFAILKPSAQDRLLEILQTLKVPIAFDPNYRPQLWQDVNHAQNICTRISQISRYFLSTFEDEQLMWGTDNPSQALTHWQSRCDAEIVIKNGAQPTLLSHGTQMLTVSAEQVTDVLDTTGAGDAFNAAYLTARLRGLQMEEAAISAHQLASQVIRHKGAILPLQDRIGR